MNWIVVRRHARPGLLAVALAGALAVAACNSPLWEQAYPEGTVSDSRGTPRYSDEPAQDTVFGRDGDLFGSLFGDSEKAGTGAGIAVNSYLWRASLDTISFMPLASADPFGGVIITDWYSPPETPNERFKMNVYILDRQLRADGVRVAVFRQQRKNAGAWSDAAVTAETSTKLENQILTRARQLRIASAANIK